MSNVAKVDPREAILSAAREKLSRFLPRAVEILEELAEGAENERVRLAAAESIADRAGLGKSTQTQVTVSSAEHEAARIEAEETVRRIQDNQRAVTARSVPLDVLIVHEGEIVEVPAS